MFVKRVKIVFNSVLIKYFIVILAMQSSKMGDKENL